MSGALGSRRNPVVCYTCVEARVSVRQVLDLQVPVRHQFDPVAIRANADAVFCPRDRGGGGRLWLTHDDYLAIQGTHHVRLYRVFLESRRKIYILKIAFIVSHCTGAMDKDNQEYGHNETNHACLMILLT